MNEQKKHSWNWKEPIEKICNGCGKSYLTKKINKKYCTQPCWTSNNNRVDSPEVRKKRVDSVRKTTSTKEYKEKIKNSPRIKEANRQSSIRMKKLIAEGKFTPCITNSWTRWKSFVEIDGVIKKFRSSWEAVFYLLNPHLEYEKRRIQYKNDESYRNYIVDFEDSNNKILYEIKPINLKDNYKNTIKIKAAQQWCKDNQYEYRIISDEWFFENANKIDYEKNPQLRLLMKNFISDKK